MSQHDADEPARDRMKSSAESAERGAAVSVSRARMDAIARLAGVVSHDFSNLLTIILGHADILLDTGPENAALRHSALEIKNAAEAAARVSADLLAISQRQSLQPRPMDVNVSIREAYETLCQILVDEIDVRLDLAADLPPVEMDPTQFARVLRLIAVHERAAMPNGGRLSIATAVRAYATCAEVTIRFADTSTCAEPPSLEPSFTGKRPTRGAGLALATCYGIVEQSGGQLSIVPTTDRGRQLCVMLSSRNRSRDPQP